MPTLMQTPEEVTRFIGGGSLDWTAWQHRAPVAQPQLPGRRRLREPERSCFYAPPSLQVEQEVPSGLPGVSQDNYAKTEYLNYNINLVHHFTGLSWLDATTSVGFARDKRFRSTTRAAAGQKLLAGANAPVLGAVQTLTYNASQQKDQSLYAQEQVLTLSTASSALTAGITAERTTNDGDIGKFYPFPRFSASYHLPQFAGFLDDLELRAAYGQSGTEPNYGVQVHAFQHATSRAGSRGASTPNLLLGNSNIAPEHEARDRARIQCDALQVTSAIHVHRIPETGQRSPAASERVAPSLGFNEAMVQRRRVHQPGDRAGTDGHAHPAAQRVRSGSRQPRSTGTTAASTRCPSPPFISTPAGFLGNNVIEVGRSVSQDVGGFNDPNGDPMQIGNVQPDFVMNFSNSVSYGPFRLSGLFEWSRGGGVGDWTDYQFDVSPGLLADSALSAKRLNQLNLGLAPYFEPGSYLKLRDLALSYQIPGRLLGWAGGRIANARLRLEGRNLFMWTGYPGLDPEVNFIGNTQVARGQDVTPYPPARSYFLGLDLGL